MSFEFHKEAVKYLADLLKKTGLKEVEYENNGVSIKLKQSSDSETIQTVYAPQPTVANVAPAQTAAVTQNAPASSSIVEDDFKSVKSPMIGTLYTASKPGADPFIQKGSKIKEGDTLFIVEAMKVMNEVKATFSGTIEQILVEDGSPIEFDQLLAKVS